ncbi:hypothetical protein Cpin_1771 [Chitinophaga pinensis DSM 2588]|uniref:Uncharacterized protein n=1 Tax=Chitinophaga pinensis (strain ATCC 43595 / DSM 2588 / LMG 13176 / NBRC 15968 / NCIMB 11800 / UQM 2034) TaxID=485918 RepID=A0A979G215_CHIPD|nr:hypothetical protein Cpin_1771 [Chitinophaga pinensis DSM 2588]
MLHPILSALTRAPDGITVPQGKVLMALKNVKSCQAVTDLFNWINKKTVNGML